MWKSLCSEGGEVVLVRAHSAVVTCVKSKCLFFWVQCIYNCNLCRFIWARMSDRVCYCVCVSVCTFVPSCGMQKKAKAPKTNVSAYPRGCHDDREAAPSELPLKWRAVKHCMPAHSHNEFTWRQSRTSCKKQEHARRRFQAVIWLRPKRCVWFVEMCNPATTSQFNITLNAL